MNVRIPPLDRTIIGMRGRLGIVAEHRPIPVLEVERPLGILDPIVRTLSAGFAVPVLNTLARTTGQYGDFFSNGVTPIALFVLAGAVIYGLWSPHFRRGHSS